MPARMDKQAIAAELAKALEKDDNQAVSRVLVILLVDFAANVQRIADALEALAEK
jgi:hypothetical protein